MSKNGSGSFLKSSNTVNIITIFVVALLSVCIVVLLAKGLFASNSAEVPKGLYTGTMSQQAVTTAPPAVSASSESGSTSSMSSAVTTAAAEEKAYVTTYVQLKKEPDEGSENIICMSPNIVVTVLERRSDGYVKLTFLNGDGTTCTGYVKSEFLTDAPVECQTEAVEEQQDEEAEEEGADWQDEETDEGGWQPENTEY